jgi:predicted Zn-dependent protease
MIKYTPTQIPESDNPNVPKESPLREFFVLLAGITGIVLVIFVLLGLLVDVIVGRMSDATQAKLESHLAPMFTNFFPRATELAPAEAELQRILDHLLQSSGQTQRHYQVWLVQTTNINAIAIPGGHIVVFSGLIAEAQSENEIAMVLGHEVGHFAHRDDLRALGRGLVLLTLSTLTLGGDDAISGWLQHTLAQAQLRHSRRHELAADAVGLEMLAKRYGHAGGATDFFRRMGEHDKHSQWAAFLMTHPAPQKRVKELDQLIAAQGDRLGDKQPLPPALKELLPTKTD